MANGTTTKKVVGAGAKTDNDAKADDGKGKRGASKRPVFDLTKATKTGPDGAPVSCYDPSTKKLTGVPDNFDFDEFKALGNSDFGNGADFMEFKARVYQHKIDSVDAKLADWREKVADFTSKAKNLRRYKDDDTRKKAMKAERMRKQLAALEAELEGVD